MLVTTKAQAFTFLLKITRQKNPDANVSHLPKLKNNPTFSLKNYAELYFCEALYYYDHQTNKTMRIKLIATFLFAVLSMAVWAQERSCGAMENLAQQLLQDPHLLGRMQAIEEHTNNFIQNHSHSSGERVVITIPVVFHIVHNGDALGTNENISDALVQAQLNQLNQDFALLNSDASLIPPLFQPVAANTDIQFCFAQRKPDGTATNGINRVNGGQASWTQSQINNTLKPTTIWDRNQYLNVWSVVFGGSSSGLLGYAQFPGGSASTDGVVVLWSSVGSVASPNPSGGNYAKGRTATHEIGHWLNLRHIWGDATCGSDLVDDTPVHNASNAGCPTYPHLSTCSGTPVEMTMNYMDYTYDACMYMFTAGQKARMQAVLATGGARVSLVSSLGCVPVSSCGTPAGLTATSVTATSATLGWTAVSGATAYNVRWRVVGAGTWLTTSTSNTSTTVSSLTSGAQYEFQVQANCNGTLGSFTGSTTFTTLTSCGTPGGLNATSINSSSAILNWTAVSGAGSYNVQWRIVGSLIWSSASTAATSYTLSSLASATNYEFQVQAVCNGTPGSFSGSSAFTTTQIPGCGTPSGLSAASITTSSATLNWASVSGATSYNVQWRPVGSGAWATSSTGSTSLAISGLSAATNYEFQVQAVCSGTPGSFSASSNFTTASNPSCGTPTGLNATSITTNSATLNWASVSGATSYNVQWRPVGSGAWSSNTTSATSIAISGLNAGTTYEFQVQAVCNGTPGSFTASANFTTTAAQSCGVPSGLFATDVAGTTATLNWSAVSGATSYNVRWRPSSGFSAWTMSSTTATSMAIGGLSTRTSYEFQVQAVCGGTSGDYSGSAYFSTTSQAGPSCGTPFGLSATSITTTTATLNWLAISGAGSYNVQWRVVGSGTWSTGSTANTSLAVSGLSAGTNYEFQVQAVCSGTPGSFSTSATFTTNSNQSCGTPTGLNASAVTSSAATLGWASVSGATSYNVQWRAVGSGTWSTGSTANTSLAVSGLSAGTNYEFQVQAVCSATPGSFSASATFTTTAAQSCGTPAGLNATAITTSTATLNWASVSGATSYNVQWRAVGSGTWSSGTSATTSLSVSGLSASTSYEFQVQAVCSGTPGSFSASANFTTQANQGTCSDNYEPNDVRSSLLPNVPVNQDFYGLISSSSDVDWHHFGNSVDFRNIRIDLTNLPADYDVILYRGGFQLAASHNSGTTPEQIIYNNGVISEDLYAYVYGYNGAFNSSQCYTLNISLSSSAFRTDGSTDGIEQTMEIPAIVSTSGFLMFPNPATDQVTLSINMDAERPVKVTVMDIAGKALSVNTYDLSKELNLVTLDVSQLPIGLYVVRVDNGNGTGIQRLGIAR